MKTDDLIKALAEDTVAEPGPAALLARLLPPALLLSFLAMWATLGLRADLGDAMTTFVPAMRHVLTLTLALLALWIGLSRLRPDSHQRLWPFALPLLAALAMLIYGVRTTPPDGLMMALEGKSNLICLVAIPLLSIAPVAAFLLAFRQGAATSPALSGALAGLAGGGLGAAIYALHCTEVSPLFYVTWYGLAIAIVATGSALVGRRLLRW